MDGLCDVTNVTVSIRRAPDDVYAYITDGENLPRWAAGLGGSVRRAGDAWIADGPLGTVTVRFAPRNELGVADHDVTLPDGTTVQNPVRVIGNRRGSTVIFTLLRLPGVTEAAFADDVRAVEKDLATLRSILERP